MLRWTVGARSSPLSRAQVEEALQWARSFDPSIEFDPVWVTTRGDLDKKTSLRSLGKSDFFTREIDDLVLSGKIRVGIHSAKDLPDPMTCGLCIAAMTEGIDPRDALVLREGETLEELKSGAVVATSSERREEAVRLLRSDFRFKDVRGTIEERLMRLQNQEADAIVIAEAALIRLKLTYLNRVYLPGETIAGQGKLALVCRQEDSEVIRLFS